jgi:hypothetical protein
MQLALTDSDIVARADNKVAAEMGDETVILDIASGYYFQLNKSGARIWRYLDAPMSVASLCRQLEAAFAVDTATCRAEVGDFIAMMRDKGLIEVRAG